MTRFNEFSLIDYFFKNQSIQRSDVMLGIGDDAALLQPPLDQLLVTTTDTLVAGVYFPMNADPNDLGHKALAVNLSDLAAMGAKPAWVLLALTLPELDEAWLCAFSAGFFALAQQHQVQLIGGDTTKGPLTITVQAMGWVPAQSALTRHGAKVGDKVYVTGTLGDAGLALSFLNNTSVNEEFKYLQNRLNRPEPRVAIGQALRNLASSAVDISDGLAADLGHILQASQVGAALELAKLPLSNALRHSTTPEQAWQLALTAGDDYELCFTAAPHCAINLANTTCIGVIEAEAGLRLYDPANKLYELKRTGYQHF